MPIAATIAGTMFHPTREIRLLPTVGANGPLVEADRGATVKFEELEAWRLAESVTVTVTE